MSLYHQPFELIEHTITWIDNRNDLISLALTAKLFCQIIIPHHIQYRHIRCHPHHDSIWKTLLECPAQAAGVRRLELIDGQTKSLVPNGVIRDTGRMADGTLNTKSIELLSKAVKHMVNLKHFAWTESAPASPALQNLFDELAGTQHNLVEFNFGVNMVGIRHLESLVLPKNIFSGLTSFAWSAHLTSLCLPNSATDLLLRGAPMLENLYLELRVNCSKYHILEEAYWPHLRRLTILNAVHLFWLQPVENIKENSRLLGRFLARHRKLECLSISGNEFEPQLVFTESFPHLRSLLLPLCQWSFPSDILEQLEHFDHPIHPKQISILERMPSLRGCSIQWTPGIMKLAIKNTWQVHRLCLRPVLGSQVKGKNLIPFLESELASLLQLQELTHLGGFMTFEELDLRHCKQARLFLSKLCRIPQLRYVEVTLDGQSTWVELERIDGEYVGYRHACYTREYYSGGL